MQKVHNFGGAEATSVFLEELLNLHRGQGYDIYWRDNNTCPTEDEYKQMVLDSAPLSNSSTGRVFLTFCCRDWWLVSPCPSPHASFQL